jgi:hypothetical protein
VRHGTGSGRGRHKNASSKETRAWHELAARSDWLKPEAEVATPPAKRKRKPTGPPPPAMPPWMDAGTFTKLLALKRSLL